MCYLAKSQKPFIFCFYDLDAWLGGEVAMYHSCWLNGHAPLNGALVNCLTIYWYMGRLVAYFCLLMQLYAVSCEPVRAVGNDGLDSFYTEPFHPRLIKVAMIWYYYFSCIQQGQTTHRIQSKDIRNKNLKKRIIPTDFSATWPLEVFN